MCFHMSYWENIGVNLKEPGLTNQQKSIEDASQKNLISRKFS